MKAEWKILRQRIAESFERAEEIGDEMLLARIDTELIGYFQTAEQHYSLEEKAAARRELFASFRGMNLLQKLLDDESINEVMVNGTEAIYVERGSRMERSEYRFEDRETLEEVIQVMASSVNRLVNTTTPIADLRLPESGYRVNVVLPPVSQEPVMTIRKFTREALTMEKLIAYGSLTEEAAAFLAGAVRAGYNIFVSGGTGSGKTTFLNALSAYIPAEERIITIEDSLELRLQGLPNLVRLEAREANLAGENAITIRMLIRNALRMRPSRIIVGEVRGDECMDMIAAMNTGHPGSLSTGHANSARDMLSRMETMVLLDGEIPLAAVRAQIASALDLVVHLGRLSDRTRRVLEIAEVTGLKDGEIGLEPIFSYRAAEGLIRLKASLARPEKWRDRYGKDAFS